MNAHTDTVQIPVDAPSSIPVSTNLTFGKCLPSSSFIFLFTIFQLDQAHETILWLLRHLLPIISPSHSSSSSTTGKVMKKVKLDLDYFLPFHQHTPSLENAWHKIYGDINQLANPNGVGLFNILAFQGVFFWVALCTVWSFQVVWWIWRLGTLYG